MQQRGVLRDHADLGAQAVLRDLADVLAVDQHLAAFDIVKTQQQVHDGGFARARAPHQADLFAAADVQRELVDHRPRFGAGGAVGKAHRVEAQLAADGWQDLTNVRRDVELNGSRIELLGLDDAHIARHDLPYNALHDHGYDSIGDTHSTLPGKGREGRWAGTERTECGLHT